jgi:hypothetical protein
MNFATVVDCLATGSTELATLLGHVPNTRNLSETELKRLWLNKVTAAGLDEEGALSFLEGRLSAPKECS